MEPPKKSPPRHTITVADAAFATIAVEQFKQMMEETIAKNTPVDGMTGEELRKFLKDHPDLLFNAVVSGFWLGASYERDKNTMLGPDSEVPALPPPPKKSSTGNMYQ